MKVFRYNISFAWNCSYKHHFNFYLLADAIVPSNIKAAVKLQTTVANEDISAFPRWGTMHGYCHFFSFLLLLNYETKYHSSHSEAGITNALFKVKLHKDSG